MSCFDCQVCSAMGPCKPENDACVANPECVELADCINGCQDQFCVDDCVLAHPEGVDDLNAYLLCLDAQCNQAC